MSSVIITVSSKMQVPMMGVAMIIQIALCRNSPVTALKNLNIPVLGIIENMSGLKCPHCGKNIDLFKSGGGGKAALEFNLPFLGKIPIDINIVNSTDEGKPYIFQYRNSETAQTFNKVVELILSKIR